MGNTIRAFLAIDLPDDIKQVLSGYIRDISGGGMREYKWVAKRNLHITLAFLGETDFSDLTRIGDAMERTATALEPFKARLGTLGSFGSVIWAGLSEGDEECRTLYDSLKSEMIMAGFKLDDRRFNTHITLARSRRRMDQLDRKGFETNESPQAVSFRVDTITLFESRLDPRGPEYIPLKSVKLSKK